MILDAGLILYIGLLVLLTWRWLSGWRFCGAALRYSNYCALLYVLLLVLLLYAVVQFIRTAVSSGGKASWDGLPGWLRPLLLGTPAAIVISYCLCCAQTLQHAREIWHDRATLKHDRAVQIVALPAVYGVLAMNSLARMFQLNSGNFHEDIHVGRKESKSGVAAAEDPVQLYISKSDTCFWVGDLYEAWALYQFGKLSLELIRASLWKMQHSQQQEEREKAHAIMVAISAVESIAWLGVSLFLIVCILQAGWSIYLLTFTRHDDWETYNTRVAQFGAAGMVASAGAIYNVHIVESTFHQYLEGYRPLLKFITVKIIVSFAFFQKGIFRILKALKQTFPQVMQNIVNGCPLLGDILNFSDVHFQLFYDSLILYECILISLLHLWGWSAHEDWYLQDKTEQEEAASERTPLVGSASSTEAPRNV
mmetsp:Transcript_86824/g.202067  ORF Transcript_86824/g.202067 Transcript_86824/m.202067 type:complete len:422 (+) Transcript_86824:150-1415(+)